MSMTRTLLLLLLWTSSGSLALPVNSSARHNRWKFLSAPTLFLPNAVTTRHRRLQHIRRQEPSSSLSPTNTDVDYFDKQQPGVPKVDKFDAHDDETTARWMRWMVGGKRRRGASDLKMREAAELGGLPRADRYSSKDWLHNTITLPNSAILRDIRSPVLCMASWATFLSVLHGFLQRVRPALAQSMCIPSTPHSLMVSALGLLLVFRTNSAYQRFSEGRKIWEDIINTSRDLYRMMTLYEKEIGAEKRRRLQRLLAAFPYLLRHRIRPNLVMHRVDDGEYRDPENTLLLYQDSAGYDNDREAAAAASREELGKARRPTRPLFWVDKRTLPWRLLPHGALQGCAGAQNRPLWVCDRMATELARVPDGPNFTNRERLVLVGHVDKLSRCIGACERIHQTVVPLNYARHSLRALTMWLLSLPFCLVEHLSYLTGPVIFLISWLLFGVYEIGCTIEDPFQGTLRLSILCDTVRRDVLGDEEIRSTAFQTEDPPQVSIPTTTTTTTHVVQPSNGKKQPQESLVNGKKQPQETPRP